MSNVTIWARVGADGTLLATSGVTGVKKFGNGRYNLTTSHDVTAAALVATVNTTGGSDPGPGNASILIGAVDGHTLYVRTATPSAATPANVDADRPFSIAVIS
jgi:hypothetical protein